MSRSRPPINWCRVEALMRVSVTKGSQYLSDGELSYLARALREDKERYRECHKRVKDQEVAKLKMQPMKG